MAIPEREISTVTKRILQTAYKRPVLSNGARYYNRAAGRINRARSVDLRSTPIGARLTDNRATNRIQMMQNETRRQRLQSRLEVINKSRALQNLAPIRISKNVEQERARSVAKKMEMQQFKEPLSRRERLKREHMRALREIREERINSHKRRERVVEKEMIRAERQAEHELQEHVYGADVYGYTEDLRQGEQVRDTTEYMGRQEKIEKRREGQEEPVVKKATVTKNSDLQAQRERRRMHRIRRRAQMYRSMVIRRKLRAIRRIRELYGSFRRAGVIIKKRSIVHRNTGEVRLAVFRPMRQIQSHVRHLENQANRLPMNVRGFTA